MEHCILSTNVRKQTGYSAMAVCVIAAMTMMSSSANAITVLVSHDGVGAYGDMLVWGGGLAGENAYGGVHLLDLSMPELFDDMPAICIELTEEPSEESVPYEIVMPEDAQNPTDFLGSRIGSVKASYLRELWAAHYDTAWFDGSYALQDKTQAAAFAAAVWEIIYEELPESPLGWDVQTDGTAGALGFRAQYLDSALANNWLRTLDGQGPMADLRALVRDGNQDYLIEVPEPATIMTLGLGGVGLLRKRRK